MWAILLTYGPVWLFYGSLAGLAVWATCRDRDLSWIGAMLVLNLVVSNLLWFFSSVESRPGAYTMLELFVALSAVMCWLEHRYRGLIALVAVAGLSIAANVALAATWSPTDGQVRMHEIITNVCFALECLIATGVGVAHGYRTGRFRRRLIPGRLRAQSDAARKEQ